jgi:hypothetical protein
MRWGDRGLAAAIVALQLAVAFALLHGHARSLHLALGLILACAAALLVAAVARALAGRALALWAALVWIGAPVALERYWRSDFRPPFRAEVLPHAFGAAHAAAAAAALFVLASLLLVLRAPRRGELAGAAVGIAILLDPHVWPAAPAPVLALALTRDPGAVARCAAPAAAGVVAALVARGLPGLTLDLHQLNVNLLQVREVAWSLRVLEYLPLAGVVAVARGSAAAGAFAAWALFTLVVLPLGGPLPTMVDLLRALVPALPLLALLAASLPLLVPRPLAARVLASAR